MSNGTTQSIVFVYILYLLLSSLSPCLLFQQLVVGMTLQAQQTALLSWKGTLGSSPALISWQQQVHPCNCTGIMCNNESVAVTGISLSSAAGLDGNLDGLTSPHSHFWTTSTSALFAYRFSKIVTCFNYLRGEIPASISSLALLSYLDFTSNRMSGNIGNLQSLTALGLSMNNLTGQIPVSLVNLTKLTQLVIHETMVSGRIPEEIGKLFNLKLLQLSSSCSGGGSLTGHIPPSAGNLTKLNSLRLYSNQLSGSIPSTLSNLINLQEYTKLNSLCGVIVLEVIMGRHPGDLLQQGECNTLGQILDQRPPAPSTADEADVALLAEVGFACLQASPEERPTMQDVWQTLLTERRSTNLYYAS